MHASNHVHRHLLTGTHLLLLVYVRNCMHMNADITRAHTHTHTHTHTHARARHMHRGSTNAHPLSEAVRVHRQEHGGSYEEGDKALPPSDAIVAAAGV